MEGRPGKERWKRKGGRGIEGRTDQEKERSRREGEKEVERDYFMTDN